MTASITTEGCGGRGALVICKPCGIERWRLDPGMARQDAIKHNRDKHKEDQ